jgi:hypothetical protein
MLTGRYKPIIKVQAILVLKPPTNVKKLRHFLEILPRHVSKAWQNAGPSLNEESVEKCQFVKQHLTMSMDHHKMVPAYPDFMKPLLYIHCLH